MENRELGNSSLKNGGLGRRQFIVNMTLAVGGLALGQYAFAGSSSKDIGSDSNKVNEKKRARAAGTASLLCPVNQRTVLDQNILLKIYV